MRTLLSLFFSLMITTIFAGTMDLHDDVPVSYKGRFRPLRAQRALEEQPSSDPLTLPAKEGKGIWLPLSSLQSHSYNFTLYSDSTFENIRTAYLFSNDAKQLSAALLKGYATIADTAYLRAANKELRYPSLLQLRAESFYYTVPWIPLCALAYIAALFLRLPGCLVAFALNTFVLVLRCYILQRPPVSSMFETVLFVPWIAMGCGLLLFALTRTRTPLIAGSAAGTALFTILAISGMANEMENVQAVLDSQYWLTIHVLMVVGSYGVFALAALLGHMYLVHYFLHGDSPSLARLTLFSLYIGTALLVIGTILGGIWAAQSWGRFWDWDPKESWAFVSSCIYLLCIHAYRFHLIGPRGLAFGAIGGFLSITFTWYGVNYILGTGLHSYGFGSGGTPYYLVFLGAESLFLGGIFLFPSKNSLRGKGSIH